MHSCGLSPETPRCPPQPARRLRIRQINPSLAWAAFGKWPSSLVCKNSTFCSRSRLSFLGNFRKNGFGLLQIEVAHAAALISMPFHHRDPFDRLLIAQACVEQIAVVSRDTIFDSYGVTRLW